MLNSRLSTRNFKNMAYSEFAIATKALGSPRRLEILDLLIQGPQSVENIAASVGQPLANTSQHLQVLKRANVVVTHRDGTTVYYRAALGVAEIFTSFRLLAERRNEKLNLIRSDYYGTEAHGESIDLPSLETKLREGTVVLLDVRPTEEFNFAHIAGARSIPISELPSRLPELPTDKLIVATCRGPFCLYAAQAVEALKASGRQAVRFDGGVTEWNMSQEKSGK